MRSTQITLAVTFVATTILGVMPIYAAPKDSIDIAQVSATQDPSQWQLLAKISTHEAKKAAEAAIGGTATNVTLADRNGGLVYEVAFGDTKVIVDAGNGLVLYSDTSSSGENNDTSFRPRSSVTIPDTAEYNENNPNQTTPNLNSPSGIAQEREDASESGFRSRRSQQIRNRDRYNGNNIDQTPNIDPPFGSVLQEPKDASESEENPPTGSEK